MYCYVGDRILLTKVRRADVFLTRFMGLMLKKDLCQSEGLLLIPCNGVHTFFMRFDLDILYLDKEFKIINFFYNIHPGKILPIMKDCFSVLETKAGNFPRDKELLNLKCYFEETSDE